MAVLTPSPAKAVSTEGGKAVPIALVKGQGACHERSGHSAVHGREGISKSFPHDPWYAVCVCMGSICWGR